LSKDEEKSLTSIKVYRQSLRQSSAYNTVLRQVLIMLAQFNIPSTVIIGGGARHQLAAQLQRLQARRALLVSDAFLVKSGVAGAVAEELSKARIESALFAQVQPDPTVRNVMDGLAELTRFNADVVVGLGGGSPMDAAKAIAVLAANPPPLALYAGYHKIPRPGLPLVVIPTTAGTGSEVTKVAVITDTERDVKMMILDAHLLPRVALVDYELSLTMPQALTAHVGVDTLTHGIEAYVSRKANVLTDPLALSCIRLVAENLRTAHRAPDNLAAREAMMTAACLGGMAFANSSVCLVHGMSRPIGAHFHVPHGLSNAVLLPDVTRYSLPGAMARYATIARTVGAASEGDSEEAASHALIDYLQKLNRELGIGRLRDVVKADQAAFESKLGVLAEAALESGSPQNNPIVPSRDDIIALYRLAGES
jgi:alcohol dehydrogenase class IV